MNRDPDFWKRVVGAAVCVVLILLIDMILRAIFINSSLLEGNRYIPLIKIMLALIAIYITGKLFDYGNHDEVRGRRGARKGKKNKKENEKP